MKKKSSQVKKTQSETTLKEVSEIWASHRRALKSGIHNRILKAQSILNKVIEPVPSNLNNLSSFLISMLDQYRLLPAQNDLLEKLTYEDTRTLQTNAAKNILELSAEADDFKFFERLAVVLKEEPVVFYPLQSKLATLLISEWTHRNKTSVLRFRKPWVPTQADKNTPLCFFTGSALSKYCRIKLDQSNLSDDIVVKTYQRLGLLPARKKIVRDVSEKMGKLVHVGFRRE
jgi:hypothetical protein